MKIELLDNTHLLIALSEEDMKTLDFTVSQLKFDNQFLEKFITQLNIFAKKEMDFSIENKKLMIEIISQNGGCLVLIKIISDMLEQKRKIYKIKKDLGPQIFIFKDIENLISAVDRINYIDSIDLKSDLIEYKNYYFLILFVRMYVPSKLKFILNEYGKFYGKGNIQVSKLYEVGNCIITNDAVEIIQKEICKKVYRIVK